MEANSTNGLEGAATPPSTHFCPSCEEPLTAARILCKPADEDRCVKCVLEDGDTTLTRIYTEQVGSLVIQTQYRKATSYLQSVVVRSKSGYAFSGLGRAHGEYGDSNN